jgi:hypothetical protein
MQLMLREMLWWNGSQPQAAQINDAVLPVSGVVRLVGQTANAKSLVFAMKAGHNEEHHNQNDVGSFIVHVEGESLLVDSGRGLYNRFYFGPTRYENIFANSYGHNVPRIAGKLQMNGRQFHGELVSAETNRPEKSATIEFARAYPVDSLKSLTRTARFVAPDTLVLEDEFIFNGAPLDIEEAFLTYSDVTIDGPRAKITGQAYELLITLEQPGGAFSVESLDAACRANNKSGVLKRLTFHPQGKTAVHMQVRPLT